MKRITKIDAAAKETKKLRVAAYVRVSTDSADQLVSLEAQKEHYEQVIKNCPNWEFAGLYYDEGVSGTKMAKRDGLLRMLADCDTAISTAAGAVTSAPYACGLRTRSYRLYPCKVHQPLLPQHSGER